MGVKLTRIEIKSYRSIPGEIRLDLGPGANVLVGPNNVGKSNLMRALGLVFGEGADAFDLERDAPAMALWARPTVTLDFAVASPVRGFEKTLLRHAKAAEEAVLAERPVLEVVAVRDLRAGASAREVHQDGGPIRVHS